MHHLTSAKSIETANVRPSPRYTINTIQTKRAYLYCRNGRITVKQPQSSKRGTHYFLSHAHTGTLVQQWRLENRLCYQVYNDDKKVAARKVAKLERIHGGQKRCQDRENGGITKRYLIRQWQHEKFANKREYMAARKMPNKREYIILVTTNAS